MSEFFNNAMIFLGCLTLATAITKVMFTMIYASFREEERNEQN